MLALLFPHQSQSQKICQIECQKVCHIVQKIYQIECQKICHIVQKIYQIERQKICQIVITRETLALSAWAKSEPVPKSMVTFHLASSEGPTSAGQ